MPDPTTIFPPAIAFSKNVIWFKPLSADYLAATPAKAVNYVEFTAAITAAETISIGWPAGGVIMTAEASPDSSGNQFPTGDGGDAYVESLVDYFQANFFIDKDFDVTSDVGGTHPRLIFSAREYGADKNFVSTTNQGTTTTGVDDLPVPNFGVRIAVFIDNLAGGFDNVYAAIHQPDLPLTGYVSADIHEILHASLTPDVPLLGETLFQQCKNSVRSYYLKYAEFFGAIPFVQKVIKTDTYTVVKGGLGMQPSLLRDIYDELFIGSEGQQTRFMRQGSKNKLVTQEQPEWLSWINLTGEMQTAAIEVTITNSDSSTTVFAGGSAVDILPGEKYQYQAGFTQLNILGRQSLELSVVYYTVRLRNEGGYLSDSYNFVVDYQPREFPGYFVYENSYGAFQTIATVGRGWLEYDRNKDDAQLSLDRSTAASIGDLVEANITLQEKGTVNVGYERSGKRETILQRDLLASHTIYLYANGVLIPIGLTTKNLKDPKTGTNSYANSIEYYYKYTEEVWTETWPMTDDKLSTLIARAGSPIPNEVPPVITDSGTIVVEFGDPHLSIDAGNQVYTAPFWLAGKTNYRIWSTQMDLYLRTEDVTYNPAGSFTILVPDFRLNDGDQLIIFPFILNP